MRRVLWVFSFAIALSGFARADTGSCFWSHIDHEVSFNDSGAWKASNYRGVANGLTLANIAGGLWEGTESRLGRTMWEAFESQVLADAGAAVLKPPFGRVRPIEGHDPCLWFKGNSGQSFPSGEAATAMALVTPYVLEYAQERPAAYALLLLPAYVGVGRVKNQAHWQSDVLAGWALGAGIGWWEHERHSPLILALLPGGAFIGLHRSF